MSMYTIEEIQEKIKHWTPYKNAVLEQYKNRLIDDLTDFELSEVCEEIFESQNSES